ncbi:MAG: hypothetical protein EXR60_05860 [Dehalococcoidia bacterium]|nr:hypothetical protein [Dehalococcoidia bacterium]
MFAVNVPSALTVTAAAGRWERPPTVSAVIVPLGVKPAPLTVIAAPSSADEGFTVNVASTAAVTVMETLRQTKSAFRSTAQTVKV